jgi:hypothetical protein
MVSKVLTPSYGVNIINFKFYFYILHFITFTNNEQYVITLTFAALHLHKQRSRYTALLCIELHSPSIS